MAKLNAAGNIVLYSTLFGGAGDDQASAIAVDSNGNVYITGYTTSLNLPVTVGALQIGNAGTSNGFAAKINMSMSGRSCSYALDSASKSFATSGGTGTVNVTAPAGCPWVAVSNVSWITVTSGSSGSGSGSVSYSVVANRNATSQSGTLTIAGQIFTVTEAAAPCTYSITPTSIVFPASGGLTNSPLPRSRAVPGQRRAMRPGSSSRPGRAAPAPVRSGYSVDANASTFPRAGTATIAGQTFTLTSRGLAQPVPGWASIQSRRAGSRIREGNGKVGAFGPPSMRAGTTRDFPIQSGSCGIPASAQAYSLNVTVVPHGRLTYLSIWPSGQSQPVVSTLNSFDGPRDCERRHRARGSEPVDQCVCERCHRCNYRHQRLFCAAGLAGAGVLPGDPVPGGGHAQLGRHDRGFRAAEPGGRLGSQLSDAVQRLRDSVHGAGLLAERDRGAARAADLPDGLAGGPAEAGGFDVELLRWSVVANAASCRRERAGRSACM